MNDSEHPREPDSKLLAPRARKRVRESGGGDGGRDREKRLTLTAMRALENCSSPPVFSPGGMALKTTRKRSGCVGWYVFPLWVFARVGLTHRSGGSMGRKGIAAGMVGVGGSFQVMVDQEGGWIEGVTDESCRVLVEEEGNEWKESGD